MRGIKTIFIRRRKLTVIVLALIIPLIFLFFLAISLIERHINSFYDYGSNIIVLDPGHGGIDGGTNYGGLLEKEINLSVAKKTRNLLEKRGYKVIMTREDDVSLDMLAESGSGRHHKDLVARTQIINGSQARLFVSFHVNSNFRNTKSDGSIVFYNARCKQGKDLAYCIQRALNGMTVESGPRTIHDPQPGSFYILENTKLPGVIVETAFISNRKEWKALATDEFRENLAESIVEGIDNFYLISPPEDKPEPSPSCCSRNTLLQRYCYP